LGLLLDHQRCRGGNQKDDQNAGDDFHHGTKSLHGKLRVRAGNDDSAHEHAGWSDFVCEVH
jgi:hypothetical protein